ncbi:MAG: hypothetical protein EZS28_012668 [Streblomastix strix]|uniref:Uncharacterized protein n=1 Tax=Streblomastix strix TaxID=222440 RepID=A0A5J4WA51_9EUKA|nr:MAG: hypothetical protein EZS28_012668 [Streblomastix strix]
MFLKQQSLVQLAAASALTSGLFDVVGSIFNICQWSSLEYVIDVPTAPVAVSLFAIQAQSPLETPVKANISSLIVKQPLK